MSVRVFILRGDGGEDGPYEEEAVLDALEAGELSPLDWCRIDDEPQAQRLGEVFERVEAERTGSRYGLRAPAVGQNRMPQGAGAAEVVTRAGGDERDATPSGSEEGEDEGEPEDESGGELDGESEPELTDAAEGELEEGPEGGLEGEREGELEEEILVYRGTPSVLAYAPVLVVAALVLAAGYWAGQFGVKWVTGALGVSLFLVVRVLLHRGAREYVVTNRWVQSTTGWVSKSTRRIALGDLTAIRLHRVGVLGWLGVGTVIFSGRVGAGGDVVFERVGRARRVIRRVREWQEAARK